MMTRTDPALVQAACDRLRRRYRDLYELPGEVFRHVVACALRDGIRRGEFRDHGTADAELLNENEKPLTK